jgi:hypothetical protein
MQFSALIFEGQNVCNGQHFIVVLGYGYDHLIWTKSMIMSCSSCNENIYGL